MLHRLILKVTKFQLLTPKRLSTVVKNTLGDIMPAPTCQIGFKSTVDYKGKGARLCTDQRV